MRRRSLITLLILTTVVLAAALLPQTPAGRGWILEQVRSAAAAAGWTLDWSDSAGNPWREIELIGARIEGPGVDARLDRVEVSWFVPALLTGDLPLWIAADGGRIDVNADELSAPQGGGGGAPITPELRAIDLENVEVAIGDAPYTLPDVRAEDLRITGRGAATDVAGRLVTPEGSLRFDARVATSPLRLDADLHDVDARLGRTWWRGVSGGTATGTARWDDDGPRIDLDLRDGRITAGGIEVDEIEGPASFRDGLVTAELSGAALGGPVAASGRVDVANRRWNATLRATPRLADAVRRFAPEALPDDLRPSGEALVTARGTGWGHVEVTGSIDADGTLAGRPLSLTGDELRYVRGEGLDVALAGEALGGTARVTTGTGVPEGWRIELAGAAYGPAEGIDGEAHFRPGGTPLLSFTASGTVLDAADLTVDGALEDGDLSTFVAGTLRPAGRVEGALALSDGNLEGTVRVEDYELAGQPPVSLELAADGPASALPVVLRIAGDEPWTPRLAGATVDADLRGSLRAVLEDGGVLRDVEGTFGPLSVAGTVDPSAANGDPRADLALQLAPTEVTGGTARANVSLSDGALRIPGVEPGSEARLTGDLRLAELALAPVEAAAVEGRLEARLFATAADARREAGVRDAAPGAARGVDEDEGVAETDTATDTAPGAGAGAEAGALASRLHATLEGDTVQAELAAGVLELAMTEQPVAVADVAGTASASLELPLARPIAGLRGTAEIVAGEATVRLEASDDALHAEALLPAGAELAGRTLQEPATLEVRLPERSSGELTATLGDARLAGTLDLEAGVPFVGTLRTGDASELYLRVGRDPWRVAADGGARLDGLAGALGLPAAGTVTASSFLLRPQGASGDARLTLEEPLPATVTWRDGVLAGAVPTPVGEVAIDGTFRAGERPTFEASHPWGVLRWTEEGIAGGGTIPSQDWRGATIEQIPWSLGSAASGGEEPVAVDSLGDLGQLLDEAELRLNGGSVRWTDGGPQAEVDLPANLAGEPARLTGTVRSVDGELDLDLAASGPGESRATARGRPDELALTLDAPAEVVGRVVAAPVDLRGDVSISASADLAEPSLDGVGSWRAGDEVLDLTLTGPPWTAVVQGPDVRATWTPATIEVRADDAVLDAFAPALAGTTLSGELTRATPEADEFGPDLLADWRGELTVGDPERGTLRLEGAGEALGAQGTLNWQGVDLDVRGNVQPELDLTATARHEPSGLAADVSLTRGPDGAPTFDGTFAWEQLSAGPAGLEAGQARLQGTLDDLRLQGPGEGTVTFGDGRLGGSLTLPLQVNDVLHELTVRPSGPPSDPAATLEVTGPSLQGTAQLGGDAASEAGAEAGSAWARLEARVEPDAWPTALDAAGLGTATVEAQADRSGTWTAAVDAALSPDDRPLNVRIDADGSGGTGMARWTVTDPAQAAPVLAGGADFGPAGLDVTADLDTLDVPAVAAAFGLDAEGESTGRLRVGWQPAARPALSVAGDARVTGTVAGVPVELEANRTEGEERVRLRSGDVEVVAERRLDAADWSLIVAGNALSLTGSLAGDLQLVDLTGTVGDEPATVRVARDPGGPLLAIGSYAGARASLALRDTSDGLHATFDASAPSSAALPAAGSLSAGLRYADGELTVERADLALVEPRPLRAELAGPAWPRADLRGVVHGALSAPADPDGSPDPLALTVRGAPSDLEVRASVAGLTLDARMGGAVPQSLALSGSGRSLFGVTVDPGEAPLTWTREVGWSGSAELLVPGDDATADPSPLLHADLRGAPEGLTMDATGSTEASGVTATGRLRATLAGVPWDASLTGEGRLEGEYLAGGESVRLDLPLQLAGTLLQPVLTGTPSVAGAVRAAGTLRAEPAGVVLSLAGPDLEVDAAADGRGWRLAADVRGLPLHPWLAALDEPTLDAEVDASSAWGGMPDELVGTWTLRATGGRAEGTAVVGSSLSLTAAVDADLAVLSDGAAAGTIRGPLAIRADRDAPLRSAHVTGSLQADGVRVGELGIEGELALDGALPIPDVVADLRLQGPVDGPLRVSWRPGDERVELVADIVAGGVQADVRVSGGPADLQASGTISHEAGALALSALDDAIVLTGRGGWDGASARLRPFADDGFATLYVPLATLLTPFVDGAAGGAAVVPDADGAVDARSDPTLADPPLGGVLEVSLEPYAATWLRGGVSAPELFGVRLPELELTAEGGTVRATGDGTEGSVDASLSLPERTWRLALRDLRLPGDVGLDADAAGRGARGSADAVLREGAGDEAPASEVRATLTVDEEGFGATAEGSLRGADLDVDVARRNGVWQGPVEIMELPTPAGRLSLSGRAAGEGAWPQAVIATRLEGPVGVVGSVTTAPDAISVDLDATLPGGEVANLQGRVWPDPVFSVRGADDGQFRLAADAWGGDTPWRATGSTSLSLPGVAVVLDEADDGTAPRVSLLPTAMEGGALVAELPAAAPLDAIGRILDDGLLLRGEGALTGEARWLPPLGLVANELSWHGAWGSLALNGEVVDGTADLSGLLTTTPAYGAEGGDAGDARRPGDDSANVDLPPLVPGLLAAPFGDGPLTLRLQGNLDGARAEIVPADPAAPAAHAVMTWSGDERTIAVDIDTEPLTVQASLRPDGGLTGSAELRGLPLAFPGLPTGAVDGSLTATGTAITGQATLRGPGRVTVNGTTDLAPLLPAAYLPGGAASARTGADAAETVAGATEVSLRVVDLNPASFPLLAERLPGLSGGLSAVVEVRGSRILVQVTAPDLETGGRPVPLRLDGAGDLSGTGSLTFGGSLAGSSLQGSLDPHALELLWRLEGFPLQAPLEALFGPLQVDVEATGVARVRLPFDGSGPPDVRLATERVRIERGDAVSEGTLSVELREGGFDVDARFEGDGQWTASGTIRPDDLDFRFEAVAADATPLLGLVPALAPLGAGASGNLTVHASGSYRDPEIMIRTNDLELALAGTRYRLTETEAVLRGADLTVQAALEGVQPVGGRVLLGGEGRLSLAPWRLQDAAIRLEGGLNVPVVGAVTDVVGLIRADSEGRPRLELDGRLGAPVRMEGTLWPLDLDIRGEGLELRAPTLLLASSTSDVDLHLGYDDRFRLSGRVAAREGRFSLGIRPRSESGREREPNQALTRFVLDDLSVTGRRLSFSENFGSAEFEADLRIGGTAAAPRVSGSADAQRGTFRFSGREFDLVRAVATFEPSRGAYPTLDVEAVTRFEKREVLGSAAEGVSFEAPSGSSFEVRLAFDAEVLPTPGEARPFRLDLDPVLTSDAVVSAPTNGNGIAAGGRALTEAELVSLVALGRLDLSGELAGTAGVAGGVAQSALNSAVDLLILSELQSALSEALGLDLVEIRTSTLSSVLEGGDDPFGVSLRLGGYLSEALFASVEVSRFGETSRELAVTNTLNLTYELGPIEFDLQTRLGFPSDADLTPVPEVSAGLRYQITPFIAIETGATVSTPESEARFGVTLRW